MTVEKKILKPKKKEPVAKKGPEEGGSEEKKVESVKTEVSLAPVAPVVEKVESHAVKPATKPRTKKSAKKEKGKALTVRGKRKEAIARASIKSGKGIIRFNRVLLDSMNNKYIQEIIREPLRYVPESNTVDISLTVCGGGVMGQAQAARTAIANALVAYFEGQNLKEKLTEIDRSLIIEDTRRVESKKYKGPKARARYQKSYR